MPLSEEELRLLEQMERALVEEDPKFASTLRGTSFRRAARRKAVLAGVVFAGGVALLMAGVLVHLALGVVGFVVMLASATYGLAALRGRGRPGQATHDEPERTSHGFGVIDGGRSGRGRPRRVGHTGSGSFMQRMEQRWHRRRDDRGY